MTDWRLDPLSYEDSPELRNWTGRTRLAADRAEAALAEDDFRGALNFLMEAERSAAWALVLAKRCQAKANKAKETARCDAT